MLDWLAHWITGVGATTTPTSPTEASSSPLVRQPRLTITHSRNILGVELRPVNPLAFARIIPSLEYMGPRSVSWGVSVNTATTAGAAITKAVSEGLRQFTVYSRSIAIDRAPFIAQLQQVIDISLPPGSRAEVLGSVMENFRTMAVRERIGQREAAHVRETAIAAPSPWFPAEGGLCEGQPVSEGQYFRTVWAWMKGELFPEIKRNVLKGAAFNEGAPQQMIFGAPGKPDTIILAPEALYIFEIRPILSPDDLRTLFQLSGVDYALHAVQHPGSKDIYCRMVALVHTDPFPWDSEAARERLVEVYHTMQDHCEELGLVESPDGEELLGYFRYFVPGPWRMPLEGIKSAHTAGVAPLDWIWSLSEKNQPWFFDVMTERNSSAREKNEEFVGYDGITLNPVFSHPLRNTLHLGMSQIGKSTSAIARIVPKYANRFVWINCSGTVGDVRRILPALSGRFVEKRVTTEVDGQQVQTTLPVIMPVKWVGLVTPTINYTGSDPREKVRLMEEALLLACQQDYLAGAAFARELNLPRDLPILIQRRRGSKFSIERFAAFVQGFVKTFPDLWAEIDWKNLAPQYLPGPCKIVFDDVAQLPCGRGTDNQMSVGATYGNGLRQDIAVSLTDWNKIGPADSNGKPIAGIHVDVIEHGLEAVYGHDSIWPPGFVETFGGVYYYTGWAAKVPVLMLDPAKPDVRNPIRKVWFELSDELVRWFGRSGLFQDEEEEEEA